MRQVNKVSDFVIVHFDDQLAITWLYGAWLAKVAGAADNLCNIKLDTRDNEYDCDLG